MMMEGFEKECEVGFGLGQKRAQKLYGLPRIKK
jgi:hypothetical protein